MNTHELKARLNGQVESVCAHLFPGGKRVAGEWVCGSISGEAGNSFKIHLAGPLAGMGKDWAEPGAKLADLLDLWGRARGVDFNGARKQAHEFLGVTDSRDDAFYRPPAAQKTYVPADNSLAQPLQSGGEVFDWLTKVRRLETVALNRFQVGQVVHPAIGLSVVWPCFAPDGGKQPDLIKYLALERQANGKKNILASAKSRPRLFGWHAFDRTARDGHLTEGEVDCITLAQNGFNALSLPMGTGDLSWIEQDFEHLECLERIFLWLDMDAAGEKCAEQLAQRLGRERCYRVRLPAPFKDANEAWQSGKFLDSDFQDLADAAKTLDPGELCNITSFRDAAWEVLHPTTQATLGTLPPVALDWRCRHGELSIWTGISGHGKTVLLNHFAVHDASQGERCCLTSLEMPAADLTAHLARIALGHYPAAHEGHLLDAAMEWLGGKFWLINKVGIMRLEKVIPLLTYAARRYGCTRFIVDSLGRLGIREDDNDGQSAALSALVEFAAVHGHVHLVCHPKKQDDEVKGPGKLAVRGSVAMTDLCNNGFTVWRNKEKESKLEEFSKVKDDPAARAKFMAQPDAQIKMWKNRKTGKEPFQTLWFHPESGQFLNNKFAAPRNYLNPPAP